MNHYYSEDIIKKAIPIEICGIKNYECESDIRCPYCDSKNFKLENEMLEFIDITTELTEDDYKKDVDCICYNCDKVFLVTVSLEFIREINYEVVGKLQPEDIIKDCPGQSYFWENLELGGIKIY